ncbi:hypothetical protein Taro_025815 [Colocasia esculenta]|uniref:Uncharacterized protein n=1 Tax=Colocasia esculenta TaxID=4460 RepID=A0A843VFB5_COLES|nr:hypothetical protein [Colocasia esculenta]
MEKVESSTFYFQELLDRRISRSLNSSLKQSSSNFFGSWTCPRILHICRQALTICRQATSSLQQTEIWNFGSVQSVDSRWASVDR